MGYREIVDINSEDQMDEFFAHVGDSFVERFADWYDTLPEDHWSKSIIIYYQDYTPKILADQVKALEVTEFNANIWNTVEAPVYERLINEYLNWYATGDNEIEEDEE